MKRINYIYPYRHHSGDISPKLGIAYHTEVLDVAFALMKNTAGRWYARDFKTGYALDSRTYKTRKALEDSLPAKAALLKSHLQNPDNLKIYRDRENVRNHLVHMWLVVHTEIKEPWTIC